MAQKHPLWATHISDLRRRLGLSQAKFGSILHYSAMAVSRWETGKLEPSARCYIQLGNLAEEREGWFFWNRAGLKRSDVGKISEHRTPIDRRASWPEFEIVNTRKASAGTEFRTKAQMVALPLLKVHAGAVHSGGTQLTDFVSGSSNEMIAAPAKWCPNPDKTNFLRVQGISMTPLIHEGDVVAVDSSQTNPSKLNGKIIVAWHSRTGLSLVRMVLADGVQLLESEDRKYVPVQIGRNSKWRIMGKVLWWIREAPVG